MSESLNDIFSIINSKENHNKVIVFGLKSCQYCIYTINDLEKYGIPFKFYDIKEYYKDFFIKIIQLSKKYNELILLQNHKTVPLIFFNSKFIGGYSDLITFF